MIHSSLHCRHLWESTGRGGAKTGVVGSKSRVDPRFQNLSFCDVTRYPTTPVFVCSKMPHFMYMEKNRGRLKSTPVFLPHETFKNSGSVHCTSTLYRSDGAIARKPFGNCHRVTKQISFSPLIFVIWGVQVLYIIKIWKSPPLTAQWTHNMIIGCRKHSITFWYNNYIKLQHLILLLTTL